MEDNDSKATEDKAVTEVIRYFEDSRIVAVYIDYGEKTPFFDGHLYLYAGGKRDNAHYTGRVAAQVKGKNLGEFKDGVFSYPIDMPDLKAYLHEGIAYFVVQEVKRKKRLFYKLLTPVDLRTIIKEKAGQDTVSVRMARATDRDIKRIEIELLEFANDCKKQVSYADSNPMDFEDLHKNGIHTFSMDVTVRDKKMPFLLAVTSKPLYIYANINESIKVPLGGGRAQISLMRDVEEPVKVGDEVFYERYRSKIEKGLLTISIADCFTLTLDPNDKKKKATLNIRRGAKMLKEVIKEAGFLLALQEKKEISAGQMTVPIPFPENHPMLERLNEHLKAWKELNDTLEKLNCNKDLDLSLVKDSDAKTIDILIDIVGKGRSLSLNNVTLGINNIKLANLKLWLVIYKNDEGKHVIKNFFDKSLGLRVSYKYPEGTLVESIYSWFDRQKLLECDNFPYDDVIDDYERVKTVNVHAYERENLFLLELLAAYDQIEEGEKKRKMYESAIAVSQWLIDHDAESIRMQNLLNRYQILKRSPGLTDDDKAELRRLQLGNSYDEQVAYAIALLLDDKTAYEYYWNRMDADLQEVYKERMPIYKFHQH